MRFKKSQSVLFVFLLLIVCGAAAQQGPFVPPDDIRFRTANIMSEGTRMAAEVFSLKSSDGKKLPTILMAHEERERAQNLAIEWFDEHLKTAGP